MLFLFRASFTQHYVGKSSMQLHAVWHIHSGHCSILLYEYTTLGLFVLLLIGPDVSVETWGLDTIRVTVKDERQDSLPWGCLVLATLPSAKPVLVSYCLLPQGPGLSKRWGKFPLAGRFFREKDQRQEAFCFLESRTSWQNFFCREWVRSVCTRLVWRLPFPGALQASRHTATEP